MELRQLATFIRVAQFKSFSRAAESLGYSQSAVTVQIRQLEEELDTRLFDRMGKRIALTDTGERFLSHACDVMNQVNQARMSVTSTAEQAGPSAPAPVHMGRQTERVRVRSAFPAAAMYTAGPAETALYSKAAIS